MYGYAASIENIPRQYRKHNKLALLLVVFFSPGHGYTLIKDAWKAALGLRFTFNFIVMGAVIIINRTRFLATNPEGIYEGYEVIGWLLLALPVWFGPWIWTYLAGTS